MKLLFNAFKHLSNASLLCSAISLALIYLVGYDWASDGLSPIEIGFISAASAGIYLIVIIVVNSYTLFELYKSLEKKQIKLPKWGYQFLIFVFLTFVFSYLLDSAYYLLDDSLPKIFANALTEFNASNKKVQLNEEQIKEFSEAIFFIQTLFGNIFGILVGGLISFPIGRVLFKKRVVDRTGLEVGPEQM